jgi:hypothetical protein
MLGRRSTPGSRAVSSDPTSIWERGGARVRRPSPPAAPSPAAPAAASHRLAEDRPSAPARIGLKEASRRYGVALATLRAWCRAGAIDAVMGRGPQGRQWMVTPASVAARKRRAGAGGRAATGPTTDGSSMLVPRDAWDRLLAQLGHLHEAGQQLAEARERAAKAETEAAFLRERLAEMRQERDGLRRQVEAPPPAAAPERRPFRLPFHRRPRSS